MAENKATNQDRKATNETKRGEKAVKEASSAVERYAKKQERMNSLLKDFSTKLSKAVGTLSDMKGKVKETGTVTAKYAESQEKVNGLLTTFTSQISKVKAEMSGSNEEIKEACQNAKELDGNLKKIETPKIEAPKIEDVAKSFGNMIKDAASTSLEYIGAYSKYIKDDIKFKFGIAGSYVSEYKDKVKTNMNLAGMHVSTFGNKVKNVLENRFGIVGKVVAKFGEKTVGVIKGTFNISKNIVAGFGKATGLVLKTTFKAGRTAVKGFGKYLKFSFKASSKVAGFMKKKFKKSFKDINKAAVKLLKKALPSAFNGLKNIASSTVNSIKNIASESVAAAKVQLEAERKLETVMKNKLGANKAEIESIKKKASTLQEAGVVGDEVSLMGVQKMVGHGMNADNIKQLMPGMLDGLAQKHGLEVTVDQASDFGDAIGQAFNGQFRNLTSFGVSVTKEQQEILSSKSASEEEKVTVLKTMLHNYAGGVNQALAKTDMGSIKQAQNIYGDLQEEIGKGLLPIMGRLSRWFVKNGPKIQEIVVGISNKINQSFQKIADFLAHHKDKLIAGISLIKGAFDDVMGFVSTSLIPSFKEIGSSIFVIAEEFAPALEVAFNILKSTGGALVKSGLNLITDAFKFIKKNIKTIAPMVIALGAIFMAYQMITILAAIGQGALNLAFAMSPIGWVVMGVVALIGVLKMLGVSWDTILAGISFFKDLLTIALWPLLLGIELIKSFFKNLSDAIGTANNFGEVVGAVFTAIKNTFIDMINWVIEKINRVAGKVGITIDLLEKDETGGADKVAAKKEISKGASEDVNSNVGVNKLIDSDIPVDINMEDSKMMEEIAQKQKHYRLGSGNDELIDTGIYSKADNQSYEDILANFNKDDIGATQSPNFSDYNLSGQTEQKINNKVDIKKVCENLIGTVNIEKMDKNIDIDEILDEIVKKLRIKLESALPNMKGGNRNASVANV